MWMFSLDGSSVSWRTETMRHVSSSAGATARISTTITSRTRSPSDRDGTAMTHTSRSGAAWRRMREMKRDVMCRGFVCRFREVVVTDPWIPERRWASPSYNKLRRSSSRCGSIAAVVARIRCMGPALCSSTSHMTTCQSNLKGVQDSASSIFDAADTTIQQEKDAGGYQISIPGYLAY